PSVACRKPDSDPVIVDETQRFGGRRLGPCAMNGTPTTRNPCLAAAIKYRFWHVSVVGHIDSDDDNVGRAQLLAVAVQIDLVLLHAQPSVALRIPVPGAVVKI